MSAIRIAFDLALLALVAFIVYRVVTRFRSTEGTVWRRLLATAWGSATFLASFATTIGSTVLIYSDEILGALNLPEFQQMLKDNVSPKVLGYVALATTALLVLGRVRGFIAALRGPAS